MFPNLNKTIRFPFYYGWIIVVVVALAGFTQSAGTFPVLGVLLNPITAEFGWSRTVFTGATTVGTIVGAVASLFVGRIIDRSGGRWLLTGALFFLGGSFVLMAWITTAWQFYALTILSRTLTMGVVALALQVIIPKWFIAKRGRAVAIGGLGMMAGGTITPLYVQFVVDVADWRIAFATAGLVIWLVSLLPVALFLRRQPEDLGLLPDGITSESTQEQLHSNNESSQQANRDISYTLKEVLRFRSFYFLLTGFALLFLVGPGMILHLIPYLTDRGIEARQAVWILVVWSGSGGIGALITGFLVERAGARRSLVVGYVLMAIGFGVLLTVNNLLLGLLWGVFMGVVGGGVFSTLYQVIFADYYGRESLGTVRSAVWPIQMLTNAAGPLTAAVAYDAFGTYVPVFATFALLMIVSALFAFAARPPGIQNAVLLEDHPSIPVAHP